jgi:hypothetical protein
MGSRGGEDRQGTCPICQLQLPLSEIEGHVQLHFGQDSEEPIVKDDNVPTVSCLQCGADVPLDQYASHEAAHRYILLCEYAESTAYIQASWLILRRHSKA